MNDQTIGSSSLEARIRRLEDRESIRGLVALYGAHVDNRDIERLGDCFTQDCCFRSMDGRMDARGRQAVIGQFHGRFAVLGPSYHFTHDSVVEFDAGDPDLARGWVNSHAEVVRNGAALLAAIRYHDEYRREDGRWRFRERLLGFFYYLAPADYPSLLGERLRNRAYEVPLPADLPEATATWQQYYAAWPVR